MDFSKTIPIPGTERGGFAVATYLLGQDAFSASDFSDPELVYFPNAFDADVSQYTTMVPPGLFQ